MKIFLFSILSVGAVLAGPQTAQLTEKVGSVRVGHVKPPQEERDAQLKDTIDPLHFVRTGGASRAQWEFNDQTFLRLGSRTYFTFDASKKNFNLQQGEAVLVFPKGQGGATISTAALTAAILGTTIYLKANPNELIYACLEGKCRVGSQVLGPGERLVLRGPQSTYNAPKQKFDLAQFIQSNSLSQKLPSESLIRAEAAKQ